MTSIEALQGCMHRDHNVLSPKPASPEPLNIDGTIVRFWDLRRELEQMPGLPVADTVCLTQCCFARMKMNMELERQHRELRRATRLRKRQRTLDILEQAEAAASESNTRRLFQLVRQLAPKTSFRKIRFRDEKGGLMAETFTQVGLQDVPQYAYRAGASTADAILRGSSHRRHIRQVLERTATDLTSRILRQTEARLVGGLMCGLDLSQAFDRLEYSEMYLALCDTGMPIALAKLLSCTGRTGVRFSDCSFDLHCLGYSPLPQTQLRHSPELAS